MFKFSTDSESKDDSIRVVTRNCLTPPLGTEPFHPGCDPAALRDDFRYDLLAKEMTEFMHKKFVICLQEVCDKWYDKFSILFEAGDYICYGRPTGNVDTGHLGCLIAYPSSIYRATRRETWSVGQEIAKEMAALTATDDTGNTTIGDEWKRAAAIVHLLLIATELCIKESGTRFTVAVWHAPCEFKYPPVMVRHIAKAIKLVRIFADNQPFIIACDLNTLPSDERYTTMTSTGFDGELPVVSASMQANGCEPESTNHTLNFKGTLDYGLLGNGFRATKAYVLNPPLATDPPIPNQYHPSDHLAFASFS